MYSRPFVEGLVITSDPEEDQNLQRDLEAKVGRWNPDLALEISDERCVLRVFDLIACKMNKE